MAPFSHDQARAHSTQLRSRSSRDADSSCSLRRRRLVGTVQVVLALPPTSRTAPRSQSSSFTLSRRRGIAELLMERAEAEARTEGKTLLVLDTGTGENADASTTGAGPGRRDSRTPLPGRAALRHDVSGKRSTRAPRMHADEVDTDPLSSVGCSPSSSHWSDLPIEPACLWGRTTRSIARRRHGRASTPHGANQPATGEGTPLLPRLAPKLPLAVPVPLAEGLPPRAIPSRGPSIRGYRARTRPS